MVSSSDRQKIQREKLLDAALVHFAAHGYAGAATSKIAATAGVPKSVLYYYFKTKEELYRETFNHILAIWDSLFDVTNAGDDPVVFVRRYVRRKIKLALERPEVSRLFSLALTRNDDNAAIAIPSFSERAKNSAKLLSKWIDEGRLRTQNPNQLLLHIWGVTEYFSTHYSEVSSLLEFDIKNDIQTEILIEEATNFVLKGCCI